MNRATLEQDPTAHAALLQSWKAVAAARREVSTLIASIERQALAARVDAPETNLQVRRTPERCVVQAGGVGLSVSWLQPQPNSVAESALLVIEWDGVITLHGEPPRATRRATPFRERGLQLESAIGVDWYWRSEGPPAREYSSEELAQWCVQLLLKRVEAAAPAAD